MAKEFLNTGKGFAKLQKAMVDQLKSTSYKQVLKVKKQRVVINNKLTRKFDAEIIRLTFDTFEEHEQVFRRLKKK